MRLGRFILILMATVLPGALAIFGLWFVTRPTPPPSIELGTPELALKPIDSLLRTQPLFFNMPAVPYVKDHWKEWSAPFGTSTPLPEELAVRFDATTQSPQAWRELDRKWHFGAVLLSGDPASFRPLLTHLRGAPDWVMTRLSPTSYVFERTPAKAWTSADLEPLLEVFKTHSLTEQKAARYQLAHLLMFMGETTATRNLLKSTLEMDPKCKEAWTELGNMHGMLGQWQEAIKAVGPALSVDRRYRPALIVQANAAFALGQYDDALEVSRYLYEVAPSDGQILLLHAKVTHAAHAYVEEIDVLNKVINLIRETSQPVGVWQLMLAQAYSATGDTTTARDTFNEASRDSTLTEENRAYIKTALERLEPKSNMLNNFPGLRKSSLLDAPASRP